MTLVQLDLQERITKQAVYPDDDVVVGSWLDNRVDKKEV